MMIISGVVCLAIDGLCLLLFPNLSLILQLAVVQSIPTFLALIFVIISTERALKRNMPH